MEVDPRSPRIRRGLGHVHVIERRWTLPRGSLHLFQLLANRDAIFPLGFQKEDGLGVFTGGLDQALKGRLGSPRASPILAVTQKAFGFR